MPDKSAEAIEANPHAPADPPPGEPEKRPELVPNEPADLPPRDPAMTAEEWEQIEERHAQAVKDWKAAQKKGHPTTESGTKPAGSEQKPFTGTTTEDLEPANKKAAAKTEADEAKASTKANSKEKK